MEHGQQEPQATPSHDRPRVFIGSSSLASALAEALYRGLAAVAHPTQWPEPLFVPGQFPLDALQRELMRHDFAVFVASGDDPLTSTAEASPGGRDHVIFEFGMFVGLLGRSRSFLVVPRGTTVVIPADLQDLAMVEYDPARARAGGAALEAAMAEVCREVHASLAPRWQQILQARAERRASLTETGLLRSVRGLNEAVVSLRQTLVAVQRDVFVVASEPGALHTLKERATAHVLEVVASHQADAAEIGATEALEALREATVAALADLPAPVEVEEAPSIRRETRPRGAITSLLQGNDAVEKPASSTNDAKLRTASLHRELLHWWEQHGPRFEASASDLHDRSIEAVLRAGSQAS